jgi:hypothetical protein
MTLHIKYDHHCPECEAPYIPYDQDVKCPRCGLLEEDRFDYIPKAADSALHNLHKGSYVPGAWWVGTYGDHVLRLVFIMLEQHRTDADGREFSAIARAFVENVDWGDQEYTREHVFAIACRVHEEIQARPLLSKSPKRWWQFWR